MNVGDTVYVLFAATKKDKPKWCRAQIQEIAGPVCRLSVWDSKRYHNKNAMVSELKTKNPNEPT